VLDGKRVTTHWHHVDKLAKKHPHLLIEKDPIFIKDGNVYPSEKAAWREGDRLGLLIRIIVSFRQACVTASE
jgi:hypothetical protein